MSKQEYNWQRIKNNPALRRNFYRRAQVIKAIRSYFDSNGFLEVNTPTVVALPGMEPNLHPFKTTVYNNEQQPHDAYLITSPEYAMKKLLCAGFSKIYEICPAFRNCEDKSPLHNTEFTILEWYRAPGDYKNIMQDVEQMLFAVNQTVNKRPFIKVQGQKVDLTPPWPRKSLADLFDTFLGLDLLQLIRNKHLFVKHAKAKNYIVDEQDNWEDVFYKLFLTHIEPKLGWGAPVFVTDYPVEMAALSKVKKDDTNFAERVEFYIGGIELGNGFSELNDADEQYERLKNERLERKSNGMELYDVDQTFIEALREGMPSAGGIAVGIDRIIMLILEKENLRDVLLFPEDDLFDFNK